MAKDYQKIARERIHTPSELKVRYKRLLVYSRNKKGKTTFCVSAPDCLVLDPEHGTDDLTVKNPKVWPIDQWEDIDDVYKFIKLGKHDYKWLAIDGMTRIYNMALRFVMHQEEERNLERRPGMVQKQDYGKAGELVKGMLTNFHALRINLVFTAQERMMESISSDQDDDDVTETAAQFVPDLPKGVRSHLTSLVGVTGRLYTVKTNEKFRDPKTKEIVERENVVQRRLWLEPHASYDTGFRSDYELPAFVKRPTIPKLVNLIETGKAV
jgi:hypothetical protein